MEFFKELPWEFPEKMLTKKQYLFLMLSLKLWMNIKLFQQLNKDTGQGASSLPLLPPTEPAPPPGCCH